MLKLDQKGQGLTEYLILLLLIAVSSVALAKSFGTVIRVKLREAKDHVNSQVIIDKSGSGGNSDQ